MIRRLSRRLGTVLYPLIGVALFLAGWHLLSATGTVPSYLLPSPARVGRAIVQGFGNGTFQRHLSPTVQATLIGYGLGSLAAMLLAALVAEFKTVERFLLLHLIAIQSIPKVSIAPLVFLWMGFDIQGKILLVALICFFPIFANALTGFRAADPNLIDLMRVSSASRWHIFWQIKLPTSGSHVFAGLEVAVAFALIGCVVMEFVGSTRGMGFIIQDSSNTFDLPLTFAAVILLGIVGVLGNTAVRVLRHFVLFWEPRDRPAGDRHNA